MKIGSISSIPKFLKCCWEIMWNFKFDLKLVSLVYKWVLFFGTNWFKNGSSFQLSSARPYTNHTWEASPGTQKGEKWSLCPYSEVLTIGSKLCVYRIAVFYQILLLSTEDRPEYFLIMILPLCPTWRRQKTHCLVLLFVVWTWDERSEPSISRYI